MKRLFEIVLSVIATAAFFISCDKNDASIENDFGEKGYITLRFSGSTLETKGTIGGDDTYHENVIKSVDLFFYPTGKTDQNAVFSAIGRDVTLVSGNTYQVKIRYSNEDATTLFGSTTSGSCEVYVVANSASNSYGSTTTISAIKKTLVSQYFATKTNGIQDNFIMDGEGTASFVSGVPTGLIYLDRDVAKFRLYACVVPYIDITDSETAANNGRWEPDINNMTITFNNALSKGYVNDTYTPGDADYFSYPERTMDQYIDGSWKEGDTSTGARYYFANVPFYTFPCTWYDIDPHKTDVLLKIIWKKKGASDITAYYKISTNRIGRALARNTYYELFTKITSLGSTDIDTPLTIDNSTYIVIDWGKVDIGAGADHVIPGEFTKYKYLAVNPTTIDLYNQTSTSMFYSSSSDISIKVNKVERYDYSQTSGKRLETITDASSLNNYTFTNDTGNTKIVFSHSQSNIYVLETIYATVSNSDGMSVDVTIKQSPAIYVDELNGDNVFVNGYFAHVNGATFGYDVDNDGWMSFRNSTRDVTSDYGTVIRSISNASDGIVNVFLTDIHVTAFNSANNTYTVGTESPQKYKIGDPRVNASDASITGSGWSLEPYYTSLNETSPWNNPNDIKVTSQESEDQNIIAPEFYICSGMNAMQKEDFETVVKRAATFQEAGFPAGRWRLPTEAEIAFILYMQQKTIIPKLFAETSESYYWAASGRLYDGRNKKFINQYDNYGHEREGYCRLVYDAWYWGSTPQDANVYHGN
jgi:hypothetical protein